MIHPKLFTSFAQGTITDGFSPMLEYSNISIIMKGCSSIYGAVYFAPDEVRTCCQRFFRGNQLCGDVVLLKTKGLSESEIANQIITAKENLLRLINSDLPDPCTGCHSLTEESHDLLISHISIEDSTVCNMRCTYCSPTFYGGATSTYDVSKVLTCLSSLGRLSDNCSIFWGGGEPVISDNFSSKYAQISSLDCVKSLRFFSNSLIYSQDIANALSSGEAQLTTSIDAGTEQTFSMVRKTRGLARVLSNLDQYIQSSKSPLQVTVKYILSHENSNLEELSSFISLYDDYPNLSRANLQISMDFKESTNSVPLLLSALDLFSQYSSRVEANHAYLDDHILHAISKLMVEEIFIGSPFHQRTETQRLKDLARSSNWVIVGDGSFAQYLAKSTYLASLQPPRAIVSLDSDSTGISGFPTISTDQVEPTDFIVIGSVSYRESILSKLSSASLDLSKVVTFPVF